MKEGGREVDNIRQDECALVKYNTEFHSNQPLRLLVIEGLKFERAVCKRREHHPPPFTRKPSRYILEPF